jgi:hypothetical protein
VNFNGLSNPCYRVQSGLSVVIRLYSSRSTEDTDQDGRFAEDGTESRLKFVVWIALLS